MQQSDLAFFNDVRAAAELRTPRGWRAILAMVLALMATGVAWAHFAVLDEVKRGNGRVVPSQQMQVLQSLEGGIVRQILVGEGDIVKQGEILMKIDDTRFSAELGEVRERRAAVAARVARLEAEVQERYRPEFAPELVALAPGAVETERNVFDARQKKLLKDIEVLEQQRVRLNESLELINRQVELTRGLFVKKIVPEIEMLNLDQKAAETKGQLAEVQSRMGNIRAAFRSQAEEDLAKSRGDLAVLDQTIKSARDRVRRAELRAPVNGIVNKLNVTTVGAVVQPGGNLMDIVPLDDTLLVEGRIRPQDIAFIHPEQAAVVKLTAYDSSIFGSLEGKVERISADTIVDERSARGERGETFYRVMIRTNKNHLGSDDHPLPIIPGMLATVEILTGKKTVLDYMLKPARLLRDEALRER
ncbi:MAG TPA: HlyD family type I secretion periplasmic adaptor subunit [Pseudolabrys sp.]|nr:HlyD family type I secretion periplasmic adaptor subunit [Pseudolabrys sp.]